MSKIVYTALEDPDDLNYGLYAPGFMFGRGLVRDGYTDTYILTGAEGVSLVFRGEGFEFDAKGRPVEGHATSIVIVLDGDTLATVTGVDIKASKLAALDTPKEFYSLLGKMDVEGSVGRDYLMGWTGKDTLQGGDGDDLLAGGKGDDRLFGGDGGDGLTFEGGKDILDGGGGQDYAISGLGAVNLKIDLREAGFQEIADGSTVKFVSVEGVVGGDGKDKLIGDAQANQLAGYDGNDSIVGNAGDDTIIGGLGDDTLKGGEGFDTVAFGSTDHGVKVSLAKEGAQNTGEGKDKIVGFENLTGTFYDDKLTGTSAFNHIEGGSGDDTIFGGGGRDGLFGGAGDDVFLFKGKVVDVANIADFNDAGEHDLIDLSGLDANANLAGDQDFSFIGTGAFTGVAGQLRWSFFGNDPSRDILVAADTNGDKVADFYVQLTSPVNALTINDFDL